MDGCEHIVFVYSAQVEETRGEQRSTYDLKVLENISRGFGVGSSGCVVLSTVCQS